MLFKKRLLTLHLGPFFIIPLCKITRVKPRDLHKIQDNLREVTLTAVV